MDFLHCQFPRHPFVHDGLGTFFFGRFSGQDVIEEEEVVETQQQQHWHVFTGASNALVEGL